MKEESVTGETAPLGCIKPPTHKPTVTTTTIIMTPYTYLTILFVCLLLQYATASASTLRGTDEIQVEDYIVMQMEMAWGMKEMARYKNHKGEWPTRSISNFQDEEETQPAQSLQQSAELQQEEQSTPQQQESTEEQRLRGNQNDTSPQDPPLGEIDDEMAMILATKNAARTVEEYWDSLVAMF